MVINSLPLHQNRVTVPLCCPANTSKHSQPRTAVRAKPAPATLGCLHHTHVRHQVSEQGSWHFQNQQLFSKPHVKLASNSACGPSAFLTSSSLTTQSWELWDAGVGLWSRFCPISQDNRVFTSLISLHQESRWHLAQRKACHYQGNLPAWFEPAERACTGPACSLVWLWCFGSSTNSPKDGFIGVRTFLELLWFMSWFKLMGMITDGNLLSHRNSISYDHMTTP